MVRILHTADWQIGKPFARVEAGAKRNRLQAERVEAIRRIGAVAAAENVALVLVAGDLFDSTTPTQAAVSATCAAIGSIGLPVYVIPGNHDHGGPGSVWEQTFFQREQASLAPNLKVILSAEALVLDEAVLLPCPLLRRHQSSDPAAWVRHLEPTEAWGERPIIMLAHGTVQGFGGETGGDENHAVANFIDLGKLPEQIDYIALGDWHGVREITPRAWYAGTPEPDRFPKGNENRPGHVLVVEVKKGSPPTVQEHTSSVIGWHTLQHHFTDDSDLTALKAELTQRLGSRVDQDRLDLTLTGNLGLSALTELETLLEAYTARLLHLRIRSLPEISPTPEELAGLVKNAQNPLIAEVARQLSERITNGDSLAATALRTLYAQANQS